MANFNKTIQRHSKDGHDRNVFLRVAFSCLVFATIFATVSSSSDSSSSLRLSKRETLTLRDKLKDVYHNSKRGFDYLFNYGRPFKPLHEKTFEDDHYHLKPNVYAYNPWKPVYPHAEKYAPSSAKQPHYDNAVSSSYSEPTISSSYSEPAISSTYSEPAISPSYGEPGYKTVSSSYSVHKDPYYNPPKKGYKPEIVGLTFDSYESPGGEPISTVDSYGFHGSHRRPKFHARPFFGLPSFNLPKLPFFNKRPPPPPQHFGPGSFRPGNLEFGNFKPISSSTTFSKPSSTFTKPSSTITFKEPSSTTFSKPSTTFSKPSSSITFKEPSSTSTFSKPSSTTTFTRPSSGSLNPLPPPPPVAPPPQPSPPVAPEHAASVLENGLYYHELDKFKQEPKGEKNPSPKVPRARSRMDQVLSSASSFIKNLF